MKLFKIKLPSDSGPSIRCSECMPASHAAMEYHGLVACESCEREGRYVWSSHPDQPFKTKEKAVGWLRQLKDSKVNASAARLEWRVQWWGPPLRNHTPHHVVLMLGDDYNPRIITFPSLGSIRLREERRTVRTIPNGATEIPINEVLLDGGELPPYHPDILLIVSQLVAMAYPERQDLVYPDQIVRSPSGAIIGCRAFARVPYATDIHGYPCVAVKAR